MLRERRWINYATESNRYSICVVLISIFLYSLNLDLRSCLVNVDLRLSSVQWRAATVTTERDLASSSPGSQDRDKSRVKYVLDSCVAGLILDGELWDHCLSSLVSYRVDLQAALFGGDERRKLSDLPSLTNYLPCAVSAYNWAKEAVEQAAGTEMLFITPTVQTN